MWRPSNLFFMFEQATFIGCWGTEEVYPEITSAWKRTVKDTELAKTDPELANLLSKTTSLLMVLRSARDLTRAMENYLSIFTKKATQIMINCFLPMASLMTHSQH